MALSGSISKTFTNNSMITAILSWTATQNIGSNNSTVTASLKLKSNSSLAPIPAWNGVVATITINGSSASSGITTGVSGGNTSGSKYTRTVTVPHNADGTKTFSFGFSINFSDVSWNGSRIGTVSHSGSDTLNTIPRASSISSISGNQIGGNVTVNISRASSSFTHRVGYYDTDGVRRSEIIDAGTSGTFSIPIDRCSLLPNATSGTAKIIVDTYSGGTRIGSTSKNHTMYVPSSVVPSISHLTATEIDGTVRALNLGTNNFVQNKSTIGLTAAATSPHGGTIRDYTFSYNGSSQGGTVGRNFAVGNVNGAKEVKVVVTDSRGRKAERKFNVSIVAYSAPKINKFNVYRVDGTTTVKADVSYTVSNIASKGGTFYIDKLVGSTWTMTNSGTMTTTYAATVTLVGAYDGAKSHSFRTNLHDAFGKGATANGTVGTNKVALDLFKDVGIGVGKTYEQGTLDVGGNTHIEGTIFSRGLRITTPTSNTAGNQQNQVMDFFRKDGTRQSGFDISGENDALRLHQYDKSGAWKSMHYFHQNGRVDLASHLTVYGWVEANELWSKNFIKAAGNISAEGEIYVKGAAVHYDYNPKIIWGVGAYHMNATQTVYPTKSLNQCRNGWILAWSDYSNGVANNYDWNFTLVPKSVTALNNGTGGMHCPLSMTNTVDVPVYSKYVYISNTQIKGNEVNDKSPLSNAVLRAVYEF